MRAFLKSYKKHPSGLSHTLYVVYKGFNSDASRQQAQKLFDVPHVTMDLGDENLDLGAYIEALRLIEDDYAVVLNTHSAINGDLWLQKLMRPFTDASIGMVGCTGSYESLSLLSPSFPRSPNPHLRSNAIAFNRLNFVALTSRDNIRTKFDAWLLESGANSLTNRIKRLKKKCVVVDKYGTVYDEAAWPGSGVFRHLFKRNTLIIDNQVRAFEAAKFGVRLRMSFNAWAATGGALLD